MDLAALLIEPEPKLVELLSWIPEGIVPCSVRTTQIFLRPLNKECALSHVGIIIKIILSTLLNEGVLEDLGTGW